MDTWAQNCCQAGEAQISRPSEASALRAALPVTFLVPRITSMCQLWHGTHSHSRPVAVAQEHVVKRLRGSVTSPVLPSFRTRVPHKKWRAVHGIVPLARYDRTRCNQCSGRQFC